MAKANNNDQIVVLWQILSWFVGHFLYKTIFYFKTVHKPRYEDISTRPLIIVGNHKSVADPWFYMTTLPFKYYRATLPMRFVATSSPRHRVLKAIYWIFTFPFVYWTNGVLVLPRRKKNGTLSINDKMRSSLDALKEGEVVIMFPEGGIKKKKGVHTFKRGVGYLQKNTEVSILCASVRVTGSSFLPWPFTKRYVNWSQELIQIPSEMLDDEEQGPEFLRKKVEELYNS